MGEGNKLIKLSVNSAWSYLNKKGAALVCRWWLLLHLPLFSELCFGWEITTDQGVSQGALQLRFPTNERPSSDNITLYVNPVDLVLFMMHQNQLYIYQSSYWMLVSHELIEAWIVQGVIPEPGMVNTVIYPPNFLPTLPSVPVLTTSPQMPVSAGGQQGFGPFSFHPHQHQQYIAQAGHNQINQLQHQSGHMFSQAFHQPQTQEMTEAFKSQLAQKDQKISELNRKIASLEQSFQGATAHVDTESHTEVTPNIDYVGLVAEKDEKITEKKDEIERLQQALHEKDSNLEQQNQHASNQEEKIRCLECEREDAKAAKEKSKHEAGQREEKLKDQLKSRVEDYKKELQWYDHQSSLDHCAIHEYQEDNVKLSQQLSESQGIVETLQQKVEDIEKQKSELKQQKDHLEAKAEELKESDGKIAEQRKEADRLRQEKNDLQTDHDKEMAEQNEMHKKELDEKTEQHRQQQQKTHEAEVREINRRSEEEKNKLEREQAKLSESVRKLKAQQAQLEADLKNKEAEIKKQKSKERQQREQLDAKTQKLREKDRETKEQQKVAERLQQEKKELQAERERKLADQKEMHKKMLATKDEQQHQQQKKHEDEIKEINNKFEKEKAALKAKIQHTPSLPSPLVSQGAISLSQPLQQRVTVANIAVQCDGAGPDMAGSINVGDLHPDDNAGKDNNKEKRKTSGREKNDEPENDAPVEDIAPSTIAGAVAEAIKWALQAIIPYLFPVTIASFASYKLGQASPITDPIYQTTLANSSNQTDIPAASAQITLVDTVCDWFGKDNKLFPLCKHLLETQDANTERLLVLLKNISTRFPDSLMYPVYSWGYWTESGSLSLNFDQLLKRLKVVSPIQPFIESLYLRTSKIKDFYQEPVSEQALTLQWLLSQWPKISLAIRGEISFERSPWKIDRFPVLLGGMVLDRALEGPHKKLRQELEKHQVKWLVPKLLPMFLEPDDGNVLASVENNSLTVFELEKDKPTLFWGRTLHALIEIGDEPILLASCSRVAIDELKQDCFGYLFIGDIWKAKIIKVLNKYIMGALPVLDFSGEGDIKAEYPEVSDDQRIDTLRYLLNWVDLYHSDAGMIEKICFIRAALTLAGIHNKDFEMNYDQVLGSVWGLRQDKHRWTGRVWSEHLLKMKRIVDDHPELTFKPVWNRHHLPSLIMMPDSPGEDILEKVSGVSIRVSLPSTGKEEGYLYRWSKDKQQWERQVRWEGEGLILPGDIAWVHCRAIYALGTSETKLDIYFALNRNCRIRLTYFNSHVNITPH